MLCMSGITDVGRETKAEMTNQTKQQVITKEKMDTVVVKDGKDQVILSRFTIYPGTSITTEEDAIGKHRVTLNMQINDKKILNEAKSIESKAKPQIYVESPTSVITTYLKYNGVDALIVSLTLSDVIWNSASVEWKSIELEKEVWELVRSTGKQLVYQVLDEKGIKRFVWTVSGEATSDLDYGSELGLENNAEKSVKKNDFNLLVKIRKTTNTEKQIITKLTTEENNQQAEYLVLELNQEEMIPVQSDLWIALDDVEYIRPGDLLLEWVAEGKTSTVTIDCNNGIKIPIKDMRLHLFQRVL